jgi:UDP-N-acetylmuramate dehydrogenase
MDPLAEFAPILKPAEPLAGRTWLRIGGPAEYLAEPRTVDELAALVRRCADAQLPLRVLGGGSNVLVREEGVPGVVLHLSAPALCQIGASSGIVTAGGGARLSQVISLSVREGLGGLESLVGIPGTIGGALRGNAGGRGGDIGQWTHRATVLTRTGQFIERARKDLVFEYRHSSLDELVIVSAQFQLEEEEPDALTRRMQQQWIVKKAALPLAHQHSACIFRNPRGMSAGMLIDQAGLMGTRVGGAEVSDRHANFIVADEACTSRDVLRLIDLVRGRVAERVGVELETELEVW